MMEWIPLLFVVLMVVATIYLGIWATRMSKTASDFFVAGRSVNVFWNSSAIPGEYLSAASFMGVAGLIMKFGYDALWYPVCYAAGYLFLLLFIAGPLRRFGAYTIPDFAEDRFDSPFFRKIAVIFVLCIGFFYTMPQMKGAGITMKQILNWPYWAGIVAAGAIITFNVALGGMKGITFVQAFQYWAKMFAISVPLFVLMAVYGGYSHNVSENDASPKDLPSVERVSITMPGPEKSPANTITVNAPSLLRVTQDSQVKFSAAMENRTREGMPAVVVREAGSSNTEGIAAGQAAKLIAGTWLKLDPPQKDGAVVPLKVEFLAPTSVEISEGAVPNTSSHGKWLNAFGPFTSGSKHPLLYTFSLILGLVCGTAGLPHILVRFYTNPDGRSAKRTTFWVMVLIGVFYMFPPIWGVLGRNVMPQLYATGETDRVVIALPTMIQSPLWGKVLSGITSAGAFAAFMSTFSGLLVSMSGALAHDIYGKILKPDATPSQRVAAFKIAALVFGAIAVLLGLRVEKFDIAKLVGWAFAIAACSYFPLLLLGSWWRGLTMAGAATGMLGGGILSTGAILLTMIYGPAINVSPLVRTLMEQPAIWGVPLAVGLMVIVSKLTSRSIPADVDLKMLRLHAPEETGFQKNYIEH